MKITTDDFFTNMAQTMKMPCYASGSVKVAVVVGKQTS